MNTVGAACSTAGVYMYLRLYTYILFLYMYRLYIYIYIYIYICMYVCYVCINVKGPLTGPQNHNFNYAWRSTEHLAYTQIFGNERTYVSQWCALWTIPSGASCPNCSRRCQTLATVRRMAAILVGYSKRKGSPDVDCTTAL